MDSYGMYPCPICGFECDSYEESEECRKQHGFKTTNCPKCAEEMSECVSTNGYESNYYCEHCKLRYSKEEINKEIKRIREAEPD